MQDSKRDSLMATLTRKQLLLSQDNISRLHDWSDRYGLSEAELVRRAIQKYNPEHEAAQSAVAANEAEAVALLGHMRDALTSAIKAVEAADIRVCEALAGLNDSVQKTAVVDDVLQELSDSPGWLDEVVDLVSCDEEVLNELS